MGCYNHVSETFVGVCKVCFKALCNQCVYSAEKAVVCSEACEQEAKMQDKLMEFYKRTYLPRMKKNCSIAMFICIIIAIYGLFILTLDLSTYLIKNSPPNYSSVTFGILLLVGGIVAFIFTKNKKKAFEALKED